MWIQNKPDVVYGFVPVYTYKKQKISFIEGDFFLSIQNKDVDIEKKHSSHLILFYKSFKSFVTLSIVVSGAGPIEMQVTVPGEICV